jgi:predicted porin
MEKRIRDYLIVGGVSAAALVAMWWVFSISPAAAGDLGGSCCADLEERIAELEATAARKGNPKVSLRVYGQVSKALLSVSGDVDEDVAVIENSGAETFVGFAGTAKISNGWSAGFVLEIGAGGFGDGLGSPDDANGIYTRRSFAYVENQQLGRVGLGLQSQATDGIAEMTTANTQHVARMLSLRPLVGPQIGDALDIFDGSRVGSVRYDSPVFSGAFLSASWANGSDDPITGSDDEVWDIALRWAGEGGGFKAIAGIGYKRGIVVPTVGNFASFADQDITVISGSASIKHIETGLFLSGAYGKFDADLFGEVKAYHGQAGIERNWNTLGLTTAYVEYADSNDLDLSIMGAGINQTIDAAAMDIYLTGRKIEAGNQDVDLIMLGARLNF